MGNAGLSEERFFLGKLKIQHIDNSKLALFANWPGL